MTIVMTAVMVIVMMKIDKDSEGYGDEKDDHD